MSFYSWFIQTKADGRIQGILRFFKAKYSYFQGPTMNMEWGIMTEIDYSDNFLVKFFFSI